MYAFLFFELFLERELIKVIKETKFLGLNFDIKLSFIPHIKKLRNRCFKVMDVIKVLARIKWGADCEVLLRLYRTLVRSKMDYGSIVYGSARKSYIKMLDTVHHTGLRLALGAFRTSPIQSLYTEAREPSLYNRRLKLALNYVVKLKANESNPAYSSVFHPPYSHLYEARPRYISPFGIRIKSKLENMDINLDILTSTHLCPIPPWDIKKNNHHHEPGSV